MIKKSSGLSNVRSNDLLCCKHRIITNSFYQAHKRVTKGLSDEIKWDIFWQSLIVVNATFCPFCDEIIVAT